MIRVSVSGLDDLEKELNAAFNTLHSGAVRILSAGGRQIAVDAKSRVMQQRDAGRSARSPLADSIIVHLHANGSDVTTDLFYAKFVEFGTLRAPAEPFLHPTFEQNVGDIQAALQSVKIEKVANG